MWLADDSAAGGKVSKLYNRYKELSVEGSKHGNLVNGNKSKLIVRSDKLYEAEEIFMDEVNNSRMQTAPWCSDLSKRLQR